MREIKLRVQVLRPLASGARGALPLVEGGAITMLGCHCRKGRATMQVTVMLGMSPRARWDATLVLVSNIMGHQETYTIFITSESSF